MPGDRADLIIRGARLIDGSGGPSVTGDIAVRDDRISAIGDLSALTAGREIAAAGRAVAPGFIDVHTHDDRLALSDPAMTPKVSQGVTTVVVGNCGISLAPYAPTSDPPAPMNLLSRGPQDLFARFASYLDRLDREPAATNVLAQVGHSTLRAAAMDSLDRPATADEVMAMRRSLEGALADGAIGLSTGLYYPPAINAETEEVIELARAVHDAGGLHSTHMRDEADHVTRSLEETFRIGREAAVPVVISHHKTSGPPNHGRTAETLPLIAAAMAAQPVALDAYPYIASSTVLLPDYLPAAGVRVMVTWSGPMPEAAGRDLDDIAAEMGVDRYKAAVRLQPAGGAFFAMDEGDVRRILAFPHTMIGSDGIPHDVRPHPRLWGTFPRVLGHYARDVGLFPVEEAVRRMTALPARHFGLTDRGRLMPGLAADLVLFDPATVIDRATFEDPIQPAAGIEAVFVNGRAVWEAGAETGARPGRAIRLSSLDLAGTNGLGCPGHA